MNSRFKSKNKWEALAHVIEECGEIAQIGGKILRFGFLSYNPYLPDPETNLQALYKELEDIEKTIQIFRAFIEADEELKDKTE